VLEFAASLPTSFKVRGRTTKRVLKLALSDSVPDTILKRKKAGFPLPYDQWLRKDLEAFVNDTILSSNAAVNDYFHKAKVRELVQSQQKVSSDDPQGGKPQHALDHSREVFSLLVLELWHKTFGCKLS
jgi:asparagine synthase (glutamine-hydrolysing)